MLGRFFSLLLLSLARCSHTQVDGPIHGSDGIVQDAELIQYKGVVAMNERLGKDDRRCTTSCAVVPLE